MPSRRQLLRSAPVAGGSLLAGCSILGGSEANYASWVPYPGTGGTLTFDRVGRFDAGALRQRLDRYHPDCRENALGCSIRDRDAVYMDGRFLAPEEVIRVVYGGRQELNSYPRTAASKLGASAFKIYEYDVAGTTVESRLGERLSSMGSTGSFDLYGYASGTTLAADDGERLVLGLRSPVRAVVRRMRGEGEPFATVRADQEIARDHLGTTAAEFVMSAPASGDDAPSWHSRWEVMAGGATFENDGVTYRSVMVFDGETVPSGVDDAAAREWTNRHFPSTLHSSDDLDVSDRRFERRGRALVVSGRTDRFVGLY